MTRYLSVLACCCLTCAPLLGEVGPKPADLKASRTKAVDFLKTSQADDGSWTSPEAPGISGLVAYSLLLSGVDVDDPEMQKALKHLETFKQPDGGIYQPKSNHANYETSICMLAFHAANKDGRYDDLLKAAEKYVRKLQWDESEDIDRTDPKYGGQGYGSTKDRPDLSNTMFFLEALQATGAKSDDPAVQKALVFLSRCQNLESEYNTTTPATKVNDGGFYYTPALGGESKAGTTPDGGLRSYGNMTYAGLKSMIFAGLTPDDPRVKAALEWIHKHYTVEENPGMGQTGGRTIIFRCSPRRWRHWATITSKTPAAKSTIGARNSPTISSRLRRRTAVGSIRPRGGTKATRICVRPTC